MLQTCTSEFGSDGSSSVNRATMSLQLCLWHVSIMTKNTSDETDDGSKMQQFGSS